MEKYDKAMEYINGADTIYIVSHIRPDGDAIGSAFAMCHALLDMGKKAYVIMQEYSKRYEFLPSIKEAVKNVKEDSYDLLICVDTSDRERLVITNEDFEKAKHVIAFDHHKNSKIPAEVLVVNDEAPATCEILYDFLLKENIKITEIMSNYIYMGLMTDTGNLNYRRTTSNTYKIAGEMLDLGADFVNICKNVNDTYPEARMKLLAYVITNMKKYCDGKVRVGIATKEIIDSLEVEPEDVEGMTNFLRMIEGTELAIYAREEENGKFKVSMRTDAKIDCSKIAIEYGGGGHVCASGFDTTTLEKDIDEIVKEVERLL